MTPTRIGFLLALLAIGLKLLGFYYGIGGEDQGGYFVMLHLLLLLIASFAAIRTSSTNSQWVELFKNGMKAVGVYSIVYCAYLYVHYQYVDPIFFEERLEQIIDSMPEADRAKGEKNARGFFTPFYYSTITLMGFLAGGAIYTMLLSILETKVLRRFSPQGRN